MSAREKLYKALPRSPVILFSNIPHFCHTVNNRYKFQAIAVLLIISARF